MAVLSAHGATFSIDDSGSSPVAVGGLVSFSDLGGGAAEDNDITTMDSIMREWRQGLADEGTFNIEYKADPNDAGQAELRSARAAQATRTCILTLDSGDIATFEGYVKSIPVAGSVGGILTGSATIKISGAVVWS